MSLLTLIENDSAKFLECMLDKMKALAEENKSDNHRIYYLNYDNGPMMYGIDLTSIGFRASNEYELWLKIYHYFQNNGTRKNSNIIFNEDTAGDILSDYYETENPNDADAMMHVIKNQIENYSEGGTIWWTSVADDVKIY